MFFFIYVVLIKILYLDNNQIRSLIDEEYPFEKGWALKDKNVSGKGRGKRMKKKVKNLLECFFHNGNINPQDKMNAQEMHTALFSFVESGEIEDDDIPKVSTIQGWISKYSAALKQLASEKALEISLAESQQHK
jgi:hypothetical protein